MKKLALIDSHALIHRAYHAIPPLSVGGLQVNAVYGFASSIIFVLKEIKPDYLIFTFDEKGPTFRHEKFENYKAGRKKSDDELIAQFPICRSLADAFGLPSLAMPGLEADDLIGSLVKKAEAAEIETIIVTGDKDSYQLISDKTHVYNLGRGIKYAKLITLDEFKADFTFDPINIVDYKALRGDASDNIPGVPGIGDKTARDLVVKFGSIEQIYSAIDCEARTSSLDIAPSTLKKLCEHKESAFTSKDLATIETNAPIELNLELARVDNYDKKSAQKFMEELQFASLIKRLPESEATEQRGLF